MERLGRVLSKQPKLTGLPPEDQARVVWRDAVGKYIASQTRPAEFVRTRLIVSVPDFTWKKQLHAMHRLIVKRLQMRLGTDLVDDVEFRVEAPRRAPASAGKTDRPLPLFDQNPADEAERIADPVFRRLYLVSRRQRLAG